VFELNVENGPIPSMSQMQFPLYIIVVIRRCSMFGECHFDQFLGLFLPQLQAVNSDKKISVVTCTL
jgi:hypothetical protein